MKKLSPQNIYALTAVFLGLWWVLTHWGFWDKSLYALGWNTTIFWGMLLLVLVKTSGQTLKKNADYLLPLGLMIASFSLWENPWLKTFTILLLPLLFGFFYAHSQLKAPAKKYWDLQILEKLVQRLFGFFPALPKASQLLTQSVQSHLNPKTQQHLAQAGLGFLILLGLSLIILPLLGSVDEQFSTLINDGVKFITEAINITLIAKALVALTIAVFVSSVLLGWNQSLNTEDKNPETTLLNEVLTSVLFIGLLLIYGLFIYTQAETLLQGSLPAEFKDTEKLVKSGFWQLFFISGINTVLFFVFYQRTGQFTQWLLRAFMLASTIILASAAWRMGLYVTLYGFSYEKFFALYTVIFSLALFAYLLYSSFSPQRNDIFKSLCFGFLWCYSLATVLPIEGIIFKANHQLAERPDSRIKLEELTMLSADVYSRAKARYNLEKNPNPQEEADHFYGRTPDWKTWNYQIQTQIKNRAWYEYNLSLWVNAQALRK